MKLNFWPFNRNRNQDSTLPEEVKDYYQAEKRERAGVAGLLAVGTLIVTVVLAIGLFFGGRWLYRTVFDNGDNAADTTDQSGEEQQEVGPDDQAATGSQDENGDQPDTQGAVTTPETPTPTPAQTPNTGPLPRTGPDADL